MIYISYKVLFHLFAIILCGELRDDGWDKAACGNGGVAEEALDGRPVGSQVSPR